VRRGRAAQKREERGGVGGSSTGNDGDRPRSRGPHDPMREYGGLLEIEEGRWRLG
jgi:hypothetical protein